MECYPRLLQLSRAVLAPVAAVLWSLFPHDREYVTSFLGYGGIGPTFDIQLFSNHYCHFTLYHPTPAAVMLWMR